MVTSGRGGVKKRLCTVPSSLLIACIGIASVVCALQLSGGKRAFYIGYTNTDNAWPVGRKPSDSYRPRETRLLTCVLSASPPAPMARA